MRENKFAIKILIPVSIITIMAAIILTYCFDFNPNLHIDFITNCILGLFTGAFLSLLLCLINYRVERRKALECFYVTILKIRNQFVQLQYYRDLDIEEKIDGLLNFNMDYFFDLDDAYGAIDMFYYSQKAKQIIYNGLYSPMKEYRETYNDNIYHLKIHKLSHMNPKTTILEHYSDNIYEKIFTTHTWNNKNEDGTSTQMSSTYNSMIKMIDEQTSYLLELIYGRKYKE